MFESCCDAHYFHGFLPPVWGFSTFLQAPFEVIEEVGVPSFMRMRDISFHFSENGNEAKDNMDKASGSCIYLEPRHEDYSAV